MSKPALVACHACDLLHVRRALPVGAVARCRRCDTVLYRQRREPVTLPLAFALAALFAYLIANSYPLLAITLQGQSSQATLIGGVHQLLDEGLHPVAATVFFTAIAAPLIQIGALLYVLLPLWLGRSARHAAAVLRVFSIVRPWAMAEIFMLGLLVSFVKLSALADIALGIGLWAFAALIGLLVAAESNFDHEAVWEQLEAQP